MAQEIEEQKLFQVLFIHLVYQLQSMAVMQLGKIVSPISNKIERDLDQAKGTIDLLRMLKEKTKNNLSKEEANLIEQVVYNLQLNYADEAAKGPSTTSTSSGQANSGQAPSETKGQAPSAGSGQAEKDKK